MIPVKMYLQTIQELSMMKRKAAERKRRLQQLLLQRNSRQQTHIILVAVGPSFSAAFDTTTPRTSTRHNLLIKEWLLQICKKKETEKNSKTYDLVDVNSGLWYRVPIFTFWHNQVDKGAMPELDMEHNYIRLYKTHKDTSTPN